ALLIALGIAAIMVLPIGVLEAVTNTQLGLNVITEMVCGYILPGHPIGNVVFKTFGYITVTQCLLFVQNLKLGHYMKIPPRSIFVIQVYAVMLGGFINYHVLRVIINSQRSYLDGS